MYNGIRLGIARAVVIAVSRAAAAESVCVTDNGNVRTPPPAGRENDSSKISQPAPSSALPAIARTSGQLSLKGGNPTVYNAFSGCGERVNVRLADGNARVSYARSANGDPLKHLAGETIEREQFVDVEAQNSLGGEHEAGYAFNMHTVRPEGGNAARKVAGGRLWINGFDDRMKLRSSLATSTDGHADDRSLAQRHEIDFVGVQGEGGTLTAHLAFVEADPSVEMGSDRTGSTRRMWTVGGRLRSSALDVNVNYIQTRDTVDNASEALTIAWRDIGGRVLWRLPETALFPDTISVRTGLEDPLERSLEATDVGDARPRAETWGVAMIWGDDRRHAKLDWSSVSESPLDDGEGRRASGRQQLAIEVGTSATEARVTSRFYSEWTPTDVDRRTAGGFNVGWSLLANIAGQSVRSSLEHDASRTLSGGAAWRWSLAAELDALRLIDNRASTDRAFALARLGAELVDPRASADVGRSRSPKTPRGFRRFGGRSRGASGSRRTVKSVCRRPNL